MQVHSSVIAVEFGGRWKPAAALALAWRTLRTYWAASYRPEKHYMRGPGPKWRAKHAQAQGAAVH